MSWKTNLFAAAALSAGAGGYICIYNNIKTDHGPVSQTDMNATHFACDTFVRGEYRQTAALNRQNAEERGETYEPMHPSAQEQMMSRDIRGCTMNINARWMACSKETSQQDREAAQCPAQMPTGKSYRIGPIRLQF